MDLVKSKYSINTERKLRFVDALFQEWRYHRMLILPNCPIPMIPLSDFSVDDLNIWLPYFLAEIRKKDGQLYRAKSLFDFLLCIQTLIKLKMNVFSFFKRR